MSAAALALPSPFALPQREVKPRRMAPADTIWASRTEALIRAAEWTLPQILEEFGISHHTLIRVRYSGKRPSLKYVRRLKELEGKYGDKLNLSSANGDGEGDQSEMARTMGDGGEVEATLRSGGSVAGLASDGDGVFDPNGIHGEDDSSDEPRRSLPNADREERFNQ